MGAFRVRRRYRSATNVLETSFETERGTLRLVDVDRAILGAAHGAFVLVVLVPLLPTVHPRMAGDQRQPEPTTLLEPPGFLALNYSAPAAQLVSSSMCRPPGWSGVSKVRRLRRRRPGRASGHRNGAGGGR